MLAYNTVNAQLSSSKGKQGLFRQKNSLLPGLLLVLGIAMIAWLAGKWLPVIGGPVFGIVLGILFSNTVGVRTTLQPGITFASKKILQWSVILLGFGLGFDQIVSTGGESLAVTFVTISVAFISALLLGKLLGINGKLRTLIGVGTAICGGSAIAAVTPIIKPEDHETAYAISTIFLFNIIAVLLFPALGHMLQLSDYGFGLWAGAAINDTSSVVAAGYAYSQQAGDYATIVKLTRATLIIPICLFLVFLEFWHQKKNGMPQVALAKIFPWFILWFLVASGIRSTGLLPEALLPWLEGSAKFMIIMALGAIGLSTNLRKIASTGIRPILLGLGVWVAVATSALLVQYGMNQL
ncbi:YeiH family protein [Advenella sp. RU8]|uniref:YeiH family protein n=1 Tax=Advenella sp. RU8 TaxID=3399575 RepID=UPI003AB0DDF1